MEMKSPPPCPNTVTVRRNPPRRARATPSSAVPISIPHSSKKSSSIRSFPIEDILSIEIPETQNQKKIETSISRSSSPTEPQIAESLKVFLRIRPNLTQRTGGSVKNGAQKNVWPQNPSRKKDALKTGLTTKKKKGEICLKVNDDLHSVTLCPPQSLQDVRRIRTEVYEGFSQVFSPESSQSEVYERMVNPLVEDFLKGKSGMLAALGPSGSGKTHTVFGSARDPGMVPLALRRIFSPSETSGTRRSRTFYLSMFEIYSERGKGEKILDLSQDGGDLYMQQLSIKGLQEAVIHDAQQAESFIASGMLKRSTAMTNSNIQSSRSQCIINIRSGPDKSDEETDFQSCTALLTIVDLAGAEREKRTGNQGARLLESNFINNTSMVFGLCLRSLLEHQKNPKKPLHKHFQSSLLTKYLRDYLEGKKRMTLILTAKSGEEDYHDTSFLLRQASPYMDIKFENVEEQPSNSFSNKRQFQTFLKVEQPKRMKFSSVDDVEGKGGVLHPLHKEELTPEQVRDVEAKTIKVSCLGVINEVNDDASLKAYVSNLEKRDRENKILLNFSRALWNVLKEFKSKLEVTESEVDTLRHSLNVEKERNCLLENELNVMKASCSCGKEAVVQVSPVNSIGFTTNQLPEPEEYQFFDDNELNAQVSPSHPSDSQCFKKHIIFALSDDETVSSSVAVNSDNVVTFDLEEQEYEVHALVSSSTVCESEFVPNRRASGSNCTSSVDILSTSIGVENFEDLGNKKDEDSCGSGRYDKNVKESEEREANEEISASMISCSELVDVLRDEISSSVEGDQLQHEKDEVNVQVSSPTLERSECMETRQLLDFALNAHVSSPSHPRDSECFKKHITFALSDDETVSSSAAVNSDNVVTFELEEQDYEVHAPVSSSTVCESVFVHNRRASDSNCTSSVDVISTSIGVENFEELSNKEDFKNKDEDSCGSGWYDKNVKESEEREANEEIAGSNASESIISCSESVDVLRDKISSSVEGDQLQHEKDEVNVQVSPPSLERSECMEKRQLLDFAAQEVSHSPCVLPEDVSSSKGCDVSDRPEKEVSLQPRQSVNALKPKRRLQPASSVLLRNINSLDFDDATEKPKGTRGQKKVAVDVTKRTQGSISLLHLLKGNLHL